MTQVRVATPDDAPAILDLHVDSIREFGPEAYDDKQVAAWANKEDGIENYPLEADDHHLVVAEADDTVVGYGHLVPANEEVRAVYVRPSVAGRGVGSTLLAHLEGYALGQGIDTLELWASLNAVWFYERTGYRTTENATIAMRYEEEQVELAVVKMEKTLGT
ncbi:GNAT family N-acetyltransferase [Halorussus halophilus]|uniref:GNAT family N-acetyltransferase n=1 Tax=Halorussus halophilus TaxID=2650975 RepID=UPI001301880B|nr:GNAT family N-acetyltransferase [Halorussus halophilus]